MYFHVFSCVFDLRFFIFTSSLPESSTRPSNSSQNTPRPPAHPRFPPCRPPRGKALSVLKHNLSILKLRFLRSFLIHLRSEQNLHKRPRRRAATTSRCASPLTPSCPAKPGASKRKQKAPAFKANTWLLGSVSVSKTHLDEKKRKKMPRKAGEGHVAVLAHGLRIHLDAL